MQSILVAYKTKLTRLLYYSCPNQACIYQRIRCLQHFSGWKTSTQGEPLRPIASIPGTRTYINEVYK